MNTKDQFFLESLGLVPTGSAESGSNFSSWRTLSRGGSVLLLLSDKGPAFRVGLSLYLPLRKIAKIVAGVLRRVPGARKFLPAVSLQMPESGVVGTILKENEVTPVSILLGNPSQAERRALLLFREGDGAMQVAKVGVSSEARKKVLNEASVLKSLHAALPESRVVPPILGSWQEEEWDGFLLPFYDQGGAGNWALGEIVEILNSWIVGGESDLVRQCSSWKKIGDKLSEEERKEAETLSLCPAVRHGDFAPWNILDAGHRKPVVIDWEFGRLDDIPGWDLVHYLLMTSHLIEQNSAEETIKKVERAMANEDVKSYLSKIGWAGHEKLLVKSYLLMMGEQLSGFLEVLEGDETSID